MTRRILLARGARGFVDGALSVVLADTFLRGGLSLSEVGVLLTTTLLGSAALTLGIGFVGDTRRNLLAASGLLMAATGIGFACSSHFVPLLAVAFVGTLNPSAGDVSVFLPLEQSALAREASGGERTRLLARYNLCGSLLGAAGSLFGGLVPRMAKELSVEVLSAERGLFVVYAAIGLLTAMLYRRSKSSAP
ncbi:MAG TPA: MFS transporter, partial [Thermoanaerobaculia bacterium]|nr:MFS transporter [Thermoanaerobaculia bacterium]